MDEASKPNDREPEGRPYGMLRWVVGGAVLLVLYILSTGPICKLADKGFIGKSAVADTYRPLIMLKDNSEVAGRFFKWYLLDVWKLDE